MRWPPTRRGGSSASEAARRRSHVPRWANSGIPGIEHVGRPSGVSESSVAVDDRETQASEYCRHVVAVVRLVRLRYSAARRSSARRGRQTRSTCVRGNEWRRLGLTEPEEFTPLWPVSVVVFGPITRDVLGRTLAAIERQTYPRDLVEVVLVHTTCPVSSAQLASTAPTARRIHCPDGEAAPRNAGARAATHDILLFLDVGLAPEPAWLAGHARWHHRVSDVVTVGSPVASGTGPASPGAWGRCAVRGAVRNRPLVLRTGGRIRPRPCPA